jgi:hypothetical protein
LAHIRFPFRFDSYSQIEELWINRDTSNPGEKRRSVDAVDCSTYERKPFWNGNYSFKFNGPGVRYEVIVDDGNIIRIDGPYRAGIRDDTIFEEGAMKELVPGEKCKGDKLYRNQLPEVFTNEMTLDGHFVAKNKRARHETANARLKRWGVLSNKFRHKDWDKHGDAFRAVAIITQLEIENGMPLFKF